MSLQNRIITGLTPPGPATMFLGSNAVATVYLTTQVTVAASQIS